MRMQEFYKEVDENVNINRTFSINDITDEDRLHQFYIIGEDVEITNILEDSEFLLENSDRVLQKIDTMLSRDGSNNSIIDGSNNIIMSEISINDSI